jgi:hypothetical protein
MAAMSLHGASLRPRGKWPVGDRLTGDNFTL